MGSGRGGAEAAARTVGFAERRARRARSLRHIAETGLVEGDVVVVVRGRKVNDVQRVKRVDGEGGGELDG